MLQFAKNGSDECVCYESVIPQSATITADSRCLPPPPLPTESLDLAVTFARCCLPSPCLCYYSCNALEAFCLSDGRQFVNNNAAPTTEAISSGTFSQAFIQFIAFCVRCVRFRWEEIWLLFFFTWPCIAAKANKWNQWEYPILVSWLQRCTES